MFARFERVMTIQEHILRKDSKLKLPQHKLLLLVIT